MRSVYAVCIESLQGFISILKARTKRKPPVGEPSPSDLQRVSYISNTILRRLLEIIHQIICGFFEGRFAAGRKHEQAPPTARVFLLDFRGLLQDEMKDRKSTRLNSSHANISYA